MKTTSLVFILILFPCILRCIDERVSAAPHPDMGHTITFRVLSLPDISTPRSFRVELISHAAQPIAVSWYTLRSVFNRIQFVDNSTGFTWRVDRPDLESVPAHPDIDYSLVLHPTKPSSVTVAVDGPFILAKEPKGARVEDALLAAYSLEGEVSVMDRHTHEVFAMQLKGKGVVSRNEKLRK